LGLASSKGVTTWNLKMATCERMVEETSSRRPGKESKGEKHESKQHKRTAEQQDPRTAQQQDRKEVRANKRGKQSNVLSSLCKNLICQTDPAKARYDRSHSGMRIAVLRPSRRPSRKPKAARPSYPHANTGSLSDMYHRARCAHALIGWTIPERCEQVSKGCMAVLNAFNFLHVLRIISCKNNLVCSPDAIGPKELR